MITFESLLLLSDLLLFADLELLPNDGIVGGLTVGFAYGRKTSLGSCRFRPLLCFEFLLFFDFLALLLLILGSGPGIGFMVGLADDESGP